MRPRLCGLDQQEGGFFRRQAREFGGEIVEVDLGRFRYRGKTRQQRRRRGRVFERVHPIGQFREARGEIGDRFSRRLIFRRQLFQPRVGRDRLMRRPRQQSRNALVFQPREQRRQLVRMGWIGV